MDDIIDTSDPFEVKREIDRVVSRPELKQDCFTHNPGYGEIETQYIVGVLELVFYISIKDGVLEMTLNEKYGWYVQTYKQLFDIFVECLAHQRKIRAVESLKQQAIIAHVNRAGGEVKGVVGTNVHFQITVQSGITNICFPIERYRQADKIPALINELKRLSITFLTFATERGYVFYAKDVMRFLDKGKVRDIYSAHG